MTLRSIAILLFHPQRRFSTLKTEAGIPVLGNLLPFTTTFELRTYRLDDAILTPPASVDRGSLELMEFDA
jgi:hypothetical protein